MQFHLSSHGADDQREERRTPEIRVPAPVYFFPRTEKGGCTSPGKSRRRHAFTCREKCGSIPAGGGKNTDAFRRRVYAAYRCGFASGVAVVPGVARRCRVLCGLVSPLFALRGSVTGALFAGRGPACFGRGLGRGSWGRGKRPRSSGASPALSLCAEFETRRVFCRASVSRVPCGVDAARVLSRPAPCF